MLASSVVRLNHHRRAYHGWTRVYGGAGADHICTNESVEAADGGIDRLCGGAGDVLDGDGGHDILGDGSSIDRCRTS